MGIPSAETKVLNNCLIMRCGNGLIHGTKRRKDNQSEKLNNLYKTKYTKLFFFTWYQNIKWRHLNDRNHYLATNQAFYLNISKSVTTNNHKIIKIPHHFEAGRLFIKDVLPTSLIQREIHFCESVSNWVCGACEQHYGKRGWTDFHALNVQDRSKMIQGTCFSDLG